MAYLKSTDYTELWVLDKQSVLTTMHKNLTADLEAGYDYFGKSIQNQLAEIARYTADYEMQLMEIADRKNPNYWCYLDMVRRGAIEA
jgi:hypothetical protein